MTPGDEPATSTAHPEHETELEYLTIPSSTDESPAGNVQVTAPAGPESTTRLGAWSDPSTTAGSAASADWVRERRENLDATRPPRMTASAPVPRRLIEQRRQPCEHCGGSGFMPGLNDYLRESIALLGDQGDEVVRMFYSTLFRIAPETAGLFPGDPTKGDLGTDHRGVQQREKLLQALVALADLYDPDDLDKMGRLDRALGSFGRSHAAFARPDGTIRGATWEEYAAVKDALFQTLVRAAESAWKAEYTEAWSQAYDYAAAVMIAEQHRSGFAAPRFPRA